MGNFDNLGKPLYTSRDKRFVIYPDASPGEYQMVINDEHYVGLVGSTLEGVARGDPGAINYVMRQLISANVSEGDVVQALLRGKISELEKHNSTLTKENFELHQSDG